MLKAPVCAWLRSNAAPILVISQGADGQLSAYIQGMVRQVNAAAVVYSDPGGRRRRSYSRD